MVEEIEEIMDEEVYYASFDAFRRQAAKYLYDYFCTLMSKIADGRTEKSTAFAIDIENNALNCDSKACAALYQKTPEWHELVNSIGWAFGEHITTYENPDTLVNRYELADLADVINKYSKNYKLNPEAICHHSNMTILVHDLYDIFIDNVDAAGPIYEVTLRTHNGYGGIISIVWKK